MGRYLDTDSPKLRSTDPTGGIAALAVAVPLALIGWAGVELVKGAAHVVDQAVTAVMPAHPAAKAPAPAASATLQK